MRLHPLVFAFFLIASLAAVAIDIEQALEARRLSTAVVREVHDAAEAIAELEAQSLSWQLRAETDEEALGAPAAKSGCLGPAGSKCIVEPEPR